jgi:uncharacterized protein YndB with AHSA1/START domain
MTTQATGADGTFETVDGRPALRFERRLSHPVEAVWRAVTDPAELAHWFPATVEVELRKGGAMRFEFTDYEIPPSTGRVTEYDPPRLFEFDWDGTLLRFELEPADGGAACVLRFTHFLNEREAAARDMAGWHVCLEMLRRHLDGAPADGLGTGVTPEWKTLYDRYTAAGVPSGAPVPGESLG